MVLETRGPGRGPGGIYPGTLDPAGDPHRSGKEEDKEKNGSE